MMGWQWIVVAGAVALLVFLLTRHKPRGAEKAALDAINDALNLRSKDDRK